MSGICLWANQICEQPNHHCCPTRPHTQGEAMNEETLAEDLQEALDCAREQRDDLRELLDVEREKHAEALAAVRDQATKEALAPIRAVILDIDAIVAVYGHDADIIAEPWADRLRAALPADQHKEAGE